MPTQLLVGPWAPSGKNTIVRGIADPYLRRATRGRAPRTGRC